MVFVMVFETCGCRLAKARIALNATPGDEFREAAQAADVSLVLHDYRRSLEKIFLTFAASVTAASTPWANTLDWLEFQTLLAKTGWDAVDWVTADDLRVILLAMNPDAFATDEELLQVQMIYPQFLEIFIALACYRFPDPFVSIAQKVQQFLEEVAFPVLRRSVGELPVPPPDDFEYVPDV
jgi:hypothetical protein